MRAPLKALEGLSYLNPQRCFQPTHIRFLFENLLCFILSAALAERMALTYLYCIVIFRYFWMYTLLVMNEAYKFCLTVSEGILPLHLWQSILTQLQMVMLPPFTLPICSKHFLTACVLLSTAKVKEILYNTFRDGVTCKGFLSCCKMKSSTNQWL